MEQRTCRLVYIIIIIYIRIVFYLVFNISLTSVISQYVQVIIACCWPYVQIKKRKKEKKKKKAPVGVSHMGLIPGTHMG